METIRLNKLLQALSIPCDKSIAIQGISDNSKDVKKDWLFVLLDETLHAFSYFQEAIEAEAFVLCDSQNPMLKKHHQLCEKMYVCANLKQHIPEIMQEYYDDVCANLCVIGVTGTNGKTSVATLIAQLLELQQYALMQIGTGFIKYQEKTIPTHNTTPGPFQLAHYFSLAKQCGITHVVMEVSSHAIDQDRIRYLSFDIIAYTNITQDHLDYHLSKTHYRYTKFKLRRYLKAQGAIIYNADFPYMQELVHLAHYNCISFGCEQAHFPIRDVCCSEHDIAFTMQGYHYRAPLLGMMNVYNLCEALVVLRRLKITYEQLREDSQKIKPISGRLEVIYHGDFAIWLDYAHTSDALKQLLSFAAEVKKGRLISIIGCGGNRDVSKRSVMADIAAQYSDIALFTSDNPRYEHVDAILADMLVHPHANVEVFENRFFAIKHAVKIAQNSDIIVIAGKGDENTLSVRGCEYPFSDRACVNELLKKEEP